SNGPGTDPVTTPKQLIGNRIKSRSGKGAKGGNRITLLRNVGGRWQQQVFAEKLVSPFGMQLIGNTLYVANDDAIVSFPYREGDTRASVPATEFTDLPGT